MASLSRRVQALESKAGPSAERVPVRSVPGRSVAVCIFDDCEAFTDVVRVAARGEPDGRYTGWTDRTWRNWRVLHSAALAARPAYPGPTRDEDRPAVRDAIRRVDALLVEGKVEAAEAFVERLYGAKRCEA